jgi:t-SNARE complex subunit (syntaxin)
VLSILDIPKNFAKANENLKWFLNNHESLIGQYVRQFIAIDSKEVIDYDSNITDLLQKLKRDEKYSESTLIEYIDDQKNK